MHTLWDRPLRLPAGNRRILAPTENTCQSNSKTLRRGAQGLAAKKRKKVKRCGWADEGLHLFAAI
jgi:hypothetical protein